MKTRDDFRKSVEFFIGFDSLMLAAEDSMFGEAYVGFCTACGTEHQNIEPDAREYECSNCGQPAVYGAEELAIMVF